MIWYTNNVYLVFYYEVNLIRKLKEVITYAIVKKAVLSCLFDIKLNL